MISKLTKRTTGSPSNKHSTIKWMKLSTNSIYC